MPTALTVEVRYDRTSDAPYHGGFGDVWKGEYCGRDVAVKVIRIYANVELQKFIDVSRLSDFTPAYYALTTPFVEVL